MKIMVKGILAVSLLFAGMSGTAFAEDTKVTVSLKGWANGWEEKADYADGTTDTFDMGSALMIGPSLNVRFSSGWFIGATYLKTMSDYEFNDYFDPTDTVTVDRADLDLTFGYMFTPRFGVFAGYKSVTASSTLDWPTVVSDYALWDMTVKGPGIGVLGNIPLSETVALYGNVALMKLTEDLEFNAELGIPKSSSDMNGLSLEAGVAVAFSESFSGNVGFKYQQFAGEEDEWGDKYTEKFSGLTFGLSYTF